MDGGNAQLLLTHGQDTTAEELHAEMCKELKFNNDSGKLFAMWICSDRLSRFVNVYVKYYVSKVI